MGAIKTISLESGNTLEIYHDDGDSNPREWDNLGKMVCLHRNYILGDKHDYKRDEYNSWEELKDAIEENERPLVILPLYLYDHSGITMNTTGFSCGWDSGQVGWIYVTKKQLEILGTRISDNETYAEFKERLKEYLVAEVKTYDQYLTGDVYGFVLKDSEGDQVNSCWGFYGDNWKENGLTDYVELSDQDLASL